MKECKSCQGKLLLTDISCSLNKMTHFKYAKCEDCGKIFLYTDEDLLCIDVFGVSDQITMFNEFARNMTNMEAIESRDINVAHNAAKQSEPHAKINSDVFEDDDDEEFVNDEEFMVTVDDEDEEESNCSNCENCSCHNDDDSEEEEEECDEKEAETERIMNELLNALEQSVKPSCASVPPEMVSICEDKNVPTEYAPYKEEPIVPKDIEHQIEAQDFGDYLIITDEFGDNDMITFTGSKDQLNDYLADLKLHSTPKVYMLKQLKIETVYKIQ